MKNDNLYRKFKWILVVTIFKKLFRFWERLGIHITRVHYYEPIPDTRSLKDEIWNRKSELIGINFNEAKQLALLSDFSKIIKAEVQDFPRTSKEISKPYDFYYKNEGFPAVDADILYYMIRSLKPRKIIEIGSGFSTFLSAKAVIKNSQIDSHESEFITIEPYPSDIIKAGLPGLSVLISKKVQEVPLTVFLELKENDILFIDSTHISSIGSDVNYEIFEILPRLQKGVLIHFHDIYLPSEYPKELIFKDRFFWNEQYLLRSFLIFNDHFEVMWSSNFMFMNYKDKLSNTFHSFEGKTGASFWLKKTK